VLFNSYQFILWFLPITLVVFFWLGKYNRQWAGGWLGIASLYFYSAWDYRDLGLLLLSIGGNYLAGYLICKSKHKSRSIFLWMAIAINLVILASFKYANFIVENWHNLIGVNSNLNAIALPLGISFYTFTQIAFLVDCYQDKVREFDPIHYLLFVTYFPHLIAGPVLHHQEMMPQFKQSAIYRPQLRNISIGLLVLTIGLVKKVILADGVVGYVLPIFGAAKEQLAITWSDAWIGALAYTLQLYFDFSGYSDMAIGIALMFGIVLPINFNSPYQATSITEFWRRWHITLSNWLRDYLYIPLGGNRHGQVRRYLNLFLTMLLGGLWHGAGWTFIIWGALHGGYLVIHQLWDKLCKKIGIQRLMPGFVGVAIARIVTFMAVVIGWVFFRADSLSSANYLFKIMASVPELERWGECIEIDRPDEAIKWILFLLIIVWFAPNTQKIIRTIENIWKMIPLPLLQPANRKFAIEQIGELEVVVSKTPYWQAWAIGFTVPSIALLVAISESQAVKEFIYFNF
jgi:alginate O-acetyltransferase complex protein AlgI